MGVNFYGILYSVKSFVPRMMAQNHGGHVVNVSSLAGIVPGIGSYWVSKHAVVVLTESLYYDLADTAPQIKISVYCPGWVDTQFYLADKSRPERFNGNPGQVTDEQRAKWREAHEKGVPITQAVDILFEGIQKDKLFIGPKAFQIHEPQLASAVRDRAEWILNEINP